jgi:isoleucyl-tRNA synthetase
MVRERGDWCISRQRSWGVPIPVFYHRRSGEVLLNADTLAHVRALIAAHGSDVWWSRDEAELLPPAYADQAADWRKGTDTMDVWFDSGSSWAGVLAGLHEAAVGEDEAGPDPAEAAPPLRYPADLYLEGSDQHRGWFQSSLLTSVAVNGMAPYRRVLTHGFVLDERGRKMSKSLGNVVDPAVLVEGGRDAKREPAYGADVLRLWVSSVDYSADVPLGPGIVRQLADVYRKVRNTARYLLGNLHDFDPGRDAVPLEDLPLLDRWMLQRSHALITAVSADFERHEFYRFFQALQNFCVVDLSNVYLDIAKDRLYVSAADDPRRRSCQTVLQLVVERLAGLIAPVLCHMAEDIWQHLPYPVPEHSVFERGWPAAPDAWAAPELEEPMARILELRGRVNRLLETCRARGELGASLEARVHLGLGEGEAARALRSALERLRRSPHPQVDDLADWLLVSDLRLDGPAPAAPLESSSEGGVSLSIDRAEGGKCERCWHIATDLGSDPAHPALCGRCTGVLATQAQATASR